MTARETEIAQARAFASKRHLVNDPFSKDNIRRALRQADTKQDSQTESQPTRNQKQKSTISKNKEPQSARNQKPNKSAPAKRKADSQPQVSANGSPRLDELAQAKAFAARQRKQRKDPFSTQNINKVRKKQQKPQQKAEKPKPNLVQSFIQSFKKKPPENQSSPVKRQSGPAEASPRLTEIEQARAFAAKRDKERRKPPSPKHTHSQHNHQPKLVAQQAPPDDHLENDPRHQELEQARQAFLKRQEGARSSPPESKAAERWKAAVKMSRSRDQRSLGQNEQAQPESSGGGLKYPQYKQEAGGPKTNKAMEMRRQAALKKTQNDQNKPFVRPARQAGPKASASQGQVTPRRPSRLVGGMAAPAPQSTNRPQPTPHRHVSTEPTPHRHHQRNHNKEPSPSPHQREPSPQPRDPSPKPRSSSRDPPLSREDSVYQPVPVSRGNNRVGPSDGYRHKRTLNPSNRVAMLQAETREPQGTNQPARGRSPPIESPASPEPVSRKSPSDGYRTPSPQRQYRSPTPPPQYRSPSPDRSASPTRQYRSPSPTRHQTPSPYRSTPGTSSEYR